MPAPEARAPTVTMTAAAVLNLVKNMALMTPRESWAAVVEMTAEAPALCKLDWMAPGRHDAPAREARWRLPFPSSSQPGGQQAGRQRDPPAGQPLASIARALDRRPRDRPDAASRAAAAASPWV